MEITVNWTEAYPTGDGLAYTAEASDLELPVGCFPERVRFVYNEMGNAILLHFLKTDHGVYQYGQYGGSKAQTYTLSIFND